MSACWLVTNLSWFQNHNQILPKSCHHHPLTISVVQNMCSATSSTSSTSCGGMWCGHAVSDMRTNDLRVLWRCKSRAQGNQSELHLQDHSTITHYHYHYHYHIITTIKLAHVIEYMRWWTCIAANVYHNGFTRWRITTKYLGSLINYYTHRSIMRSNAIWM
jgi:hypothetical protein